MQYAALILHPLVEPGSGDGGQDEKDGEIYFILFTESDRALEDSLVIMVKAEDKAPYNHDAVIADFFNGLLVAGDIVDGFIHGGKVVLGERLNAHKEAIAAHAAGGHL